MLPPPLPPRRPKDSQMGGLERAGGRTNAMAPAPRSRKRRRIDDTLEDWEKYDGVQSARTWEWDAGKEDFGDDLAEFSEWSSLLPPSQLQSYIPLFSTSFQQTMLRRRSYEQKARYADFFLLPPLYSQ